MIDRPTLRSNVQVMPPPASKPLSPVLTRVQRAILRTRSFRANAVKGYLAALGVMASLLALRLSLSGVLDGIPFLFFLPGIVIAAFLGGVGAGIFAVVVSGVAAWFFILQPVMGIDLSPQVFIAVGIYIVTGSMAAVMVGWLISIAQHVADFEEHEKLLLRELQHRVKNHVQIVSSLLQIQARRADAATAAALNDAGRRLATISAVYGSLYRSGHQIDFKAHLEELCRVASRAAPDTQCEFTVDAEAVSWGMDIVMPLSLIAGELIANAIRHGCSNRSGRVAVALRRFSGQVQLSVSDSGARLPPGFDVEKSQGLGLQLARTLSRQIQGSLMASGDPETRFVLTFPEMPAEPH